MTEGAAGFDGRSGGAARVSGIHVASIVCRREMVRFLRQPVRVIAAIGTPVLLWLFMASGLADAIASEALSEAADVSYSAFMLPGIMTLTAVFTAIFASISVIEDRNEGWLQGALVSPAPRWALAAGKICGGGAMAFGQAALLFLALPFLGIEASATAIGLSLLGLLLTSVAMAGVGFAFAWRCETTASFHAVMNLVFMPMWLLSGAFFPAERVHPTLSWLVSINPLTWATQSIRAPLLGEPGVMAIVLTLAFAAIACAAAMLSMAQRR